MQKGFINIGLVIILLLILIGAGYFVFKDRGEKEEAPIKEEVAQTTTVTGNNCIQIDNLSQGDQVSFPLTITGILNPNAPTIPVSDCIRIFEGEAGFAGVQDLNSNNLLPGVPIFIKATGNWMVNAPVPFIAEIPSLTVQPASNDLKIIFSGGNDPRDNPPPPPPDATFILNVTL